MNRLAPRALPIALAACVFLCGAVRADSPAPDTSKATLAQTLAWIKGKLMETPFQYTNEVVTYTDLKWTGTTVTLKVDTGQRQGDGTLLKLSHCTYVFDLTDLAPACEKNGDVLLSSGGGDAYIHGVFDAVPNGPDSPPNAPYVSPNHSDWHETELSIHTPNRLIARRITNAFNHAINVARKLNPKAPELF